MYFGPQTQHSITINTERSTKYYVFDYFQLSLQQAYWRSVTYLLPLKEIRVEHILQVFVHEIDAQLLQAVCVEDLKARDVKQPDEPLARGARRNLVVRK